MTKSPVRNAGKSFRQVGLAKQGKLIPRPPHQKGIARVPPSIPSKYRAAPPAGPSESDAFGARTSRFTAAGADLCPGPGYYVTKKTDKTSRSVSHSRKGYGVGFVSKIDRFSKNHSGLPAPGPGQYEIKVGFSDDKPVQETAGAFDSTSARFATRAEPLNETPGPGKYKMPTKNKRNNFNARLAHGTFRSSSTRGSYLITAENVPAPGTYNVTKSVLKGINEKVLLPSAAFRSGTRRFDSSGTSDPGPGAYTWASSGFDHATAGNRDGQKGTSVFSNAKCNRFGQPYRSAVDKGKGVPGPGHYTPFVKPQQRVAASSGWALSAVMRDREITGRQAQPPGPCYYKRNLSTIGKRSFHLNSTKLWV